MNKIEEFKQYYIDQLSEANKLLGDKRSRIYYLLHNFYHDLVLLSNHYEERGKLLPLVEERMLHTKKEINKLIKK